MKLLLLLLTCLPFLVFTQSEINFGRVDDDALQNEFKIEINQLRSYIYNDIPESLKDELRERKMYRFADQSAFISSNILISGSVYNGWRQADLYLNAILQKILPEHLKDKPYLKAYVLKDGNHNAFMTPSGQLFLNIGIFDEMESESSLAGILAHEVAHYELRHSVEGFIKQERGEFKSGFLFRNEGAASRFSIDNELQADSLACSYLQNAGYDPQGLIDAFEAFSRIEENDLLRQQYQWETEETTHPRSDKRMNSIEALVADAENVTTAKYIISEGAFNRIKNNAKAEILKYLLDDFDYHRCLEKAFKYHLFDPYNPTYIYYVMEAIRRSCYLNPELWNENFFVHRYYDVIEEGGERKKVEIDTHIFDKYRPELLGLPDDSYERIQAKFYWEEDAKFMTNSQAFDFFFQISELLNEPECILTFALSFTAEEDEEKRDTYLNQYLENENILHREYAQQLVDGNIYSDLNNQKLCVFNRFFTIIRQGKHEVLIWKEPQTDQSLLIDTIKAAVATYPNRTFLYLPTLKKSQLNNYLALLELERFSSSYLISKNSNTALHILDPAYWELLKKFEVNEIEFLNCIYRDVVKSDGSVEGYQKVANSSHHDYLKLDRRVGRHLNIFLTSVRIKAEEAMKMRYYDGEDRLGSKADGYQQTHELLIQKLNAADAYKAGQE